jgi:UDP-glucuronate 4-epimerase
MRLLVTGAAGFIGSAISRAADASGLSVTGIDAMTDYYDIAQKRAAQSSLPGTVEFEERDVLALTADDLEGVEAVCHQAAQPGVRNSWGEDFALYARQNIVATQHLLDVCVQAGVKRVVYASSSSAYGNSDSYPVTESAIPRPFSPYGVTKLAGEHLALAYAQNTPLEVVALRYFTVYGPGQRPDMAMHRMIKACLNGSPFPLFGDGLQVRDFTYVDDVVRANLLALTSPGLPDGGLVMNVCGGTAVSLGDVATMIERLCGAPLLMERRGVQAGDVARTGGSNARAERLLGWTPQVALEAGLAQQVAWARAFMAGEL